MKLYGNLQNRLEEGLQFCEEIKVGTGVTEYLYSDRHAYEVVAVKDQKHFTIRRYDRKHIGEAYENSWELISNKDNQKIDIVKRGNAWYSVITITKEQLPETDNCLDENGEPNLNFYIAMNGFDRNVIIQKGKQTKYRKKNISIGKADEYFDYEF